jgi:nucleotide-binding universal stress UspA family protein
MSRPAERLPLPDGARAAIRHVLLVLPQHERDRRALDLAIATARRERAILTVALAERDWTRSWYPAYGGVDLLAAQREAEVLGERLLAAARDEIPTDVSVRTVCLSGPGDPCRRIRAYALAHGVDLVVSERPRRRAAHRLESGPVPVSYPVAG